MTRQAVSRWETGETVPNIETLKLLSRFFDVSINTLLGAPRQLICQCCGMPLEDGNMSREPDGSFNEDYCKWCYTDGAFTYQSMDALIDFCAAHMANDAFPPVRSAPTCRTCCRSSSTGRSPRTNNHKIYPIWSQQT